MERALRCFKSNSTPISRLIFPFQTCERRLEDDHAGGDGGQPQEEDVAGEEDARLAQVALQDLVVVHLSNIVVLVLVLPT